MIQCSELIWYDLFMNYLIIKMTNILNQVLNLMFFKKLMNLVKLTKLPSKMCWLLILQWVYLLVLWHTALMFVNCNKNSDENFVKTLINFDDLENEKLPSNHKFYILTQVFFLSNFMFDKISDKFNCNGLCYDAYFKDFKSKMSNFKHPANTYCNKKLNCDNWIFKHNVILIITQSIVFMKLTNFYVKYVKFCINTNLWLKILYETTFISIFILNLYYQDINNPNLLLKIYFSNNFYSKIYLLKIYSIMIQKVLNINSCLKTLDITLFFQKLLSSNILNFYHGS